MAKIWFAKDGERPTPAGVPVAEKSLEWCVDNLGLRQSDWIAALESPPRFGKGTHLDAVRDPRYVVVEVENGDITGSSGKGWKSGFYLARLSINQVKEKLQIRTPID